MVSLECRSKCEGSVGEDDDVTTLVKENLLREGREEGGAEREILR